ncbi:rod shape-determining protein RodA [Bacteroidia bacterium]|nr:rod shape-determining protein RodA [Bacteroidia bacterium]
MFLAVGTGVVLAFHHIRLKFFPVIGICIIFAWILIVITMLWGPEINGTSRWINLGSFGFQPSEVAKLCLIVFTASNLSQKKTKEDDKRIFLRILIATVVTCILIGIDNGSTALLLFGIIIVMMFIGQISWKRLGLLLAGLVVAVGLLGTIMFTVPEKMLMKSKLTVRMVTWKHRIMEHRNEVSVTDPAFEINDDNFQSAHGYIAIANGKILGRFPGHSTERDVLPQAYSDFIYAIIIEEMGLILGGLGVLLLYVILFIRSGIIAKQSKKNFSKYVVIGCSLMLVLQALANMAVAVGIIPVTGQPMPLMSSGGTSTLITCVYFGIILSVSRFDNPKGLAREQEIEAKLKEEKERKNEKPYY